MFKLNRNQTIFGALCYIDVILNGDCFRKVQRIECLYNFDLKHYDKMVLMGEK